MAVSRVWVLVAAQWGNGPERIANKAPKITKNQGEVFRDAFRGYVHGHFKFVSIVTVIETSIPVTSTPTLT